MCLFPTPNFIFNGEAYRKGLDFFECGACPECLRRRASKWSLRAVHESRDHAYNCMVCLTYDQFVRDSFGRIIGERLPDDMSVKKRDIQLFIKRLRKHFAGNGESNIKYIACAEYGKRTHRPHYHVLLFGVKFSDCVPYKRSKRGNFIYRSKTLESLWKNGICTVDSQLITSAAARYCTKYCCKDTRNENTFMLCSQNIGLSSLITDFNGKSYIVEGREFPIPREVWQRVISARYSHLSREFTYKYVNTPKKTFAPVLYSFESKAFHRFRNSFVFRSDFVQCVYNDIRRARYRRLRDGDLQYQQYLKYWREKSALIESRQGSVFDRIRALPDDKYHNYKIRAIETLMARLAGIPCRDPRHVGFYEKFYASDYVLERKMKVHLPLSSRPITASDTNTREFLVRNRQIIRIFPHFGEIPLKKRKKSIIQLGFFDKGT